MRVLVRLRPCTVRASHSVLSFVVRLGLFIGVVTVCSSSVGGMK